MCAVKIVLKVNLPSLTSVLIFNIYNFNCVNRTTRQICNIHTYIVVKYTTNGFWQQCLFETGQDYHENEGIKGNLVSLFRFM